MNHSYVSGAPVRLENLSRRYDASIALNELTLDIAAGEFFTILGPSGSGKTTTLMLIAGFTTPSAGEIYIGDRRLSRVPPHRRNVGVVFQNYSLFPHMSVTDNVAFPLQLRGQETPAIEQRVRHMLELVQLTEYSVHMPHQLSGGQQQRVALARALASDPEVLLLDEPLSALDKSLRAEMQLELKALHQKLKTTVLCVTHDQAEALALSDRIAILNHGSLEQVGTPEELYEKPASRFVATFIGDSNILSGRYGGDLGRFARVSFGSELGGCGVPRGSVELDGDCDLLVRPHHITVGESASGMDNSYEGVIGTSIYGGDSLKLEVVLPGGQRIFATVSKDEAQRARWIPGSSVRVGFSSENAAVYPSPGPVTRGST